uniref:GMP phosphodiesterase delta subunit domain-containing protein n=2 Tax=Tetranychus urticae TaxID=32264 RepID=T1KD33_TETUR
MSEPISEEEKKEKERSQILAEGFKLHRVSLKDPESKEVLWSTKEDLTKTKEDFKVHLEKNIHERTGDIMMEIVFSSTQAMENFNLKKRLLFKNKCLEEWFIEFGEVKEKSAYTWQIMLTSSPDVMNMPFDALSGQLMIESKYCDQELEFHKGLIRVFYDGFSTS